MAHGAREDAAVADRLRDRHGQLAQLSGPGGSLRTNSRLAAQSSATARSRVGVVLPRASAAQSRSSQAVPSPALQSITARTLSCSASIRAYESS